PAGRFKSPSSLIDRSYPWLIKIKTIPKFAGHGSMCLIESLTIVRISTASHFVASASQYFHEPIGISKCLSGHADNICLTEFENSFSLLESCNPACGNNRRRESGLVHTLLDCFYQGNTTSKGTDLIRQDGWHTFISTSPGIRVYGLPYFR